MTFTALFKALFHFFDFIKTYLFQDRSKFIDRSQPLPENVDLWASGACLLIKCSVFEKLEGLDERFYLYCEDIDFCKRALAQNIKVHYVEEAKLIHYRRRYSKGFFTKYFFWHVASVFKYALCPTKLMPKKSSLKQITPDNTCITNNEPASFNELPQD